MNENESEVDDRPGSPSARDGTDAGSRSSVAGISAFFGRVLEVSLSVWLPAAMLVGNAAVLFQIHRLGRPDLFGALRRLTEKPLGTITVLLFALLLVAMITQAFQFEMIRLLEGYVDGANRPLRVLIDWRIRRHEKKRTDLYEQLKEANQRAFAQARLDMLRLQHVSKTLMQIIDDEIFGRPHGPEVTTEQVEAARAIDWEKYAHPAAMHLIDALNARTMEYPEPHRLMPTHLGNVLRAGEDTLPVGADENLESYVIRYLDQLPQVLSEEHRDHRRRLDMYCSLVLNFWFLAGLSVVILSSLTEWWLLALVALGYATLATVSYKAAIATAHGYVEALQEIGRHVIRQREIDRLANDSARSRLRSWSRTQERPEPSGDGTADRDRRWYGEDDVEAAGTE